MRKPILVCVILVLVIGMVVLSKFQLQSASLSIDEIAPPGDVVKIEYRHGGNGLFYKTENITEINHFIQSLRATTYRKTKPNPWTGSGSLQLYDKENKKIIGMSFGPNQDIQINGVYFRMTNDINDRLKTFFDEFLIDNNVVKGK
ncbi:hypothetical protein [Paenibacillus sp. Root444D2]|uniref:hypothetical protein n=1 Tax=Paenibacillus sp. Root444D2 TaxID=1736538 RepID=UPI00070A9EEE|nr:hypothetical protein [Paenibacillus sp. Root444D2]KQX46875.1 hypothetical protein ASD40_16480 [Paenibacillus sp. Root444D2]